MRGTVFRSFQRCPTRPLAGAHAGIALPLPLPLPLPRPLPLPLALPLPLRIYSCTPVPAIGIALIASRKESRPSASPALVTDFGSKRRREDLPVATKRAAVLHLFVSYARSSRTSLGQAKTASQTQATCGCSCGCSCHFYCREWDHRPEWRR